MAGLNFQTQTIINSNLDPDSGKGVKLFEAADGVLRIKRDFDFYKDKEGYGKVCAIRKRAGYEAKLCKAEIDFANILADLKPDTGVTYARLDIYLGVEGAEPFIYATPWVQKGMPFWVEFTVKSNDTAATLAEAVAKLIKNNHIFLHDKDLINLTVNGTKLVLEGATEYQRFRQIAISKFAMSDDYSDEVAELGDDNITLKERGENAFGTYSQIVKDLRLPTGANWQPLHIRKIETPIIDAIYNQYIIEYQAPASNDGLACVGQRLESNTLHVFWVKNDTALISEWETALGKVGTIEDVDAASEGGEQGGQEGGEQGGQEGGQEQGGGQETTPTYTAVADPTGNPSAQGWYELDGNTYVLTQDTEVANGKTYYTKD